MRLHDIWNSTAELLQVRNEVENAIRNSIPVLEEDDTRGY
jgi:hypothetical protein